MPALADRASTVTCSDRRPMFLWPKQGTIAVRPLRHDVGSKLHCGGLSIGTPKSSERAAIEVESCDAFKRHAFASHRGRSAELTCSFSPLLGVGLRLPAGGCRPLPLPLVGGTANVVPKERRRIKEKTSWHDSTTDTCSGRFNPSSTSTHHYIFKASGHVPSASRG